MKKFILKNLTKFAKPRLWGEKTEKPKRVRMWDIPKTINITHKKHWKIMRILKNYYLGNSISMHRHSSFYKASIWTYSFTFFIHFLPSFLKNKNKIFKSLRDFSKMSKNKKNIKLKIIIK